MDPSAIAIIFILIMIVGIVMRAAAGTAAVGLRQQFSGMGTLRGRSRAEIEAVVGPPNSVSGLPGGKQLLQWQRPGYHIALRFDGDVCDGVTHEHSAR
jgi:hypothetical protein